MFEYSLVVFNQFHQLKVLQLEFQQLQFEGVGWNECSLLPILGDLHLPCLTSLNLGTECGLPEDGYNDETLVAPELTFIGVPETCCIQCNLILPQSAASQRLGRGFTVFKDGFFLFATCCCTPQPKVLNRRCCVKTVTLQVIKHRIQEHQLLSMLHTAHVLTP